MRKRMVLVLTHGLVALAGFAAGIYALPILTAPPAPGEADLKAAAGAALFTGHFRRDLKDSDALHWGEGVVSVGRRVVALQGRLAPGPDYRLYLSSQFVETKADFLRLKPKMVRVGDVRTFDGFLVVLPEDIDPARFNTVIVWCESFNAFITSAQYRS